jgi:1,2-dihydroxy-3-keto-5-methylthiopentene dioxygenase
MTEVADVSHSDPWRTKPPYLIDNPDVTVDSSHLEKLGVFHRILDADNHETDPLFAALTKARGYTYSDIVDSTKMANLQEKLANFMIEHIHDDDEVRFFLDGSGYFDFRDDLSEQSPWVRLHCFKGDLVVIPAGSYHRFVPDEALYFKVKRLFVGDPVWTPWNKSDTGTESRTSRQAYAHKYLGKS